MAFGRYTTNARDPHAYGTCDGGAAASTNAAAVLHVVLLRLPRDFASRAAAMRLDLRGTVPMRQAECECSGRFEAGGPQSSAAIISSALRVRNAVERRHTLQPLRIFALRRCRAQLQRPAVRRLDLVGPRSSAIGQGRQPTSDGGNVASITSAGRTSRPFFGVESTFLLVESTFACSRVTVFGRRLDEQ